MDGLLVPFLLVALLPGFFLAWRLGWVGSRKGRWALALVALAATLSSMPWGGVDFVYIKRLNLLIAAAVTLLLGLRTLGIGWATRPRPYRRALTALAGLAVLGYLNFFDFHGERTFVHLHDVAHYYLGAKYYDELGYSDLYTAMLRAEAEVNDNHFKAIEARDLETYHQVHIRTLLQRSDPIKEAFAAARWRDFKLDVTYFRDALGPLYGRVLLDHGFNPTPAWALVGHTLSQWVPAGNARGIWMLSLLDPLLLLLMLAAIWRTFGGDTALLATIYLAVLFGAGFSWIGGAFLRFPWLVAVVVAACCLHRRRWATAGTLVAAAALLRVFPAAFFLPLVLRAGYLLIARRRLPRRYLRLAGGAALATVVLLLATASLPRGWHHWGEFRDNMKVHLANIAPNVVGLTDLLAFRPGAPSQVTQEELDQLKQRRQRIHDLQLWLVFPPLLLLVGGLALRRRDSASLVLALPFLWAGLSLAGYYYACLVLLVLVWRRQPAQLMLIFAVEVASQALRLFEDRESRLFLYRSLLVGWLFVALELEALKQFWLPLWHRTDRALNGGTLDPPEPTP